MISFSRVLTSAALVAAATSMLPSPASAQAGWFYGEHMEAAYGSNFATSGRFECWQPFRFVTGSCTASGASLTITNGNAWMTMTFAGAASDYVATNTRRQDFVLGTFSRTYGGTGPFVLPATVIGDWTMFSFKMQFSSTVPVARMANLEILFRGYVAGAEPSYQPLQSESEYWTMPSERNPAFARYDVSWVSYQMPALRAGDTTPIVFGGSVGLAPEPSTYVMLGTGLLTLAGVARRRRRSTLG